VADYFTMSNTVSESNADEDLGSGGVLVLPDMADANGTIRHLAVGAGKDQTLYLVDRDNMGKFNPTADNIYQELRSALPGGIYGMPAYFNGRLYYGPAGYNLIAFQFSKAKLQTNPVSSTGTTFTYPGATPSISANGSADAIVWATENTSPAVLHAYDASDLSKELYNSNQAGTRDQFGTGNKFITPTIANGKVYVGTTNGVGAFGLLTGQGGDFSVNVSSAGSASVTVSPGQTAQYSLSLAASGGFNQSVSFTCNGAPAEASCSVSPSSATPGNSATGLMVNVSTTAPSQTVNLRWPGMWLGVVILLAVLGAAARLPTQKSQILDRKTALPRPWLRRELGSGWRSIVVLGILALAVAYWASCGGGASALMTNPGTPAGTYTLTVTGTSTSNSTTLTHSVTLQLVVN
jgi:hypothetical protein